MRDHYKNGIYHINHVNNLHSQFKKIQESLLTKEENQFLITVGGTVSSFRFNLKDGKKFETAYWDSILRNPNDINYKVSAKSVENLWGNLAYDKNSVNKCDLPVINKIK